MSSYLVKLFIMWLIVMGVAACGVALGEDAIVIIGHPSKEEKAASYEDYVARGKRFEAQEEARIKREHELDVEKVKFAEALLLEEASAPKVTTNSNVNVESSYRTTMNTHNSQVQK